MTHPGPVWSSVDKSANIDFGQRHELFGNIAGVPHRRNCHSFARGELSGAAMLHLQRGGPCTGAGGLHHKPFFLQHPHRRPQHALHSAWGRNAPKTFWRLLLLYGELYGHFSDHEHNAEHGSSQYRPLDSGGLSFNLFQQNET